MAVAHSQIVVDIKGLTKSFGGIIALHNADIDFRKGEVHALAGENGAGKSTLCKMLSGAIIPDSGTIRINGIPHTRLTPKEAKLAGVGMIYQEFNLVPDMPVYENIFIGKEIRKGITVDTKEMILQTEELFERMEVKIDPKAYICNLSVAYCQLIEIAKALKEHVEVLIMDEPTAPLTNQEVDVLFKLVNNLKEHGITIIYISHRMEEITNLSDRVTIMRDGAVISTLKTSDTTQHEIISRMVGRELGMNFPLKKQVLGKKEKVLSVRNIKNSMLQDVSFDLYRGEILGLAGLVGSGRTETLRAIFGADKMTSGDVLLHGDNKVTIKTPKDAIKKGIGLIPEDRKRQGVHLSQSIKNNMTLIKIKDLSIFATISKKEEQKLIDRYVDILSIKLASPHFPASSLSGGNQQKVVLAKWLAMQPDIIFFDEPTRGIDVAAKSEIYELMDTLRNDGKAIIMVSSEMPEIIGMCDRILVMYEGRITGELTHEEATQPRIMELASGIV
ncbi:sugar ABC transporter ATP-binding protein [Sediminispirochaeta smaragdinae]|uniref:ABC transporter related protein n=1 Tax=Sediminispirochaeta smaragdinae (strain DSM 11293 / JCM 15392 / SEBR 4228) TaxID=573413 RepID=E1R8N2_SEDSS|nr:sugar ABC transporter ATP-binding protein [Sediminispirochaeta smaragdinae]ADK81789.1 ABC transporter related protein [Sediminispirochaeta smaragdinae DSM 11293]